MSKILKVFSLFYKLLDKFIVTPISTLVYKLQSNKKRKNKLEKLLNKPNFLLILSLVFAFILFVLVDTKALKLVSTDAEYLKNQPVKVLYNSSAYVVEGVPETVNITLIGKKSELYLAKQLGDSEVVVDLTDYEPSDKPVEVKLTYNKNIDNLDYRIDPTYVTVTIKKKVSDTRSLSYDLLNNDKLDAKLNVKSVQLSKNDVVVRGSQESLDKIASVKALIDLSNEEFTKAGTYTVENIDLVAYSSSGELIKDVEIVATKIVATVTLDSYSKKVPVRIETKGSLVTGKAISSITINGKDAADYDVTIYGDEDTLENIEYVPVELDIEGQGNNGSKSITVTFPKPTGVRSLSETSVVIVLNFDEARQSTITLEGVTPINVPSGLVANLEKEEDKNIEIQVIGVKSVIDELGDKPTGIEAYVDLSSYTTAGVYNVDVKVKGDDSRLQYVVKKTVSVVLSKSSD